MRLRFRVILLAAATTAATGIAAPCETLRLTPGRPVEREMAGGEVHEYSIALETGQAASIAVSQRDIDVVLEAADPSGRPLLKIDAPIGSWGEERAVLIARKTGDYSIRVISLHALAVGRYEIRISELRRSTERDSTLEAAQATWADGYRLDHDRTAESARRAVGRYEEAALLWSSVGERRQQAVALLGAARVQRFLGSTLAAHELDRKALELARGCRDRDIEARLLHRLGMFLLSTADPNGAMNLFQQERSLEQALGNRQGESFAVNGLGQACWLLGQYQRAVDFFVESLALMRGLRDLSPQARASAGLGLLYQELGEPEKAIPHHREALALWRAARRPEEQSWTLRNLALAYSSMDLHSKALETLEEALALARAIGHQGAQAAALEGIGFERLGLGDPERACEDLAAALAVWRKIGNVSGEATTLLHLGRCHAELGRREEARREWEAALQISRKSGDRRLEAITLAEIARLHLALGNLDEARTAVDGSIELLESIRGELAEPALRRSFLSSRQDPYAIAVDVLLNLDERRPGSGFRALAFQASELGRARALAEAIVEARLDLSGDSPPELRREENELSSRLARLENDERREKSDRKAITERLGEAEEQWDRLMGEMRRRRSAAVEYPRPISLSAARRLLGPETALVSYSTGTDQVLVFVLTDRQLDVHRLRLARSTLAERVENYVGLISRDSRDAWQAQAAGLYRDLVAPWRERLAPAIRRLVIIPDGPLHSLPFESLVPPGAGSHRLVEDFAISYDPSVTVLGELEAGRARPSGAAESLLVLASPTVSPAIARGGEVDGEAFDLSPVPYAALEAKMISRFGGKGSEIRIGEQASEKWVRTLPLNRFGVIHFATHGLLNQRVPSRSALLLAGEGNAESGDGLLRARDVYRLRLSSSLVVLSACQTARGTILPGEGVQGLAQAFFSAGARSVVASLWDVRDARTARFMASFYAHLSEGLPKTEALRAAKLDELRAEPDLAPRYWAPFVLIGEGMETITLRRRSRSEPAGLYAGAVAAGVLAVLARWARSRRKRNNSAATAA